mmetsp:Transcript_6472/g.11072  ORF Transcript_6472/g.11072 Transcript_6472/m.11072 type:complete len:178 (-) Transcript_6472:198-731(-)
MASLRPKRTAVKSAASPKRQAATGDSSSETEVRAEAKEALALARLSKCQELQSIRLQAKVQQLAQLRRRLQEQKVAVTASSEAASLEDLNERDVARQREESCRRLRQTLLQSLKKKQEEDQESDELSETLVVESVEPPTAKKRVLEEERQPVQLKAASKVPRLVAAKPLRLTPRQGS